MKESTQLKGLIAENRQKIAALRQQIGKLAGRRAGVAESLAIQSQIVSLRQGIRSLENSIENLERRLHQVEPLENMLDWMQAQAEQAQRERREAAEAAHGAALRSVALAEWLKVPGQTQAGFDQVWPAMAAKIATEQATNAATELHTAMQHGENETQRIALDLLANRYKLPNQTGRQAGAVIQQVLSK